MGLGECEADPQILLVSAVGMEELFEQVAHELNVMGISSNLYPDAAACLADSAGRRSAVAILAMHDFPLSREFLVSMPMLRGALSFVTGTEGYDESAATELGIAIGNGQVPENFNSMAEATIMLILAGLYDLNGAQDQLRRSLPRPAVFRATMLMGKSVGLIGFGRIARAVVERLQGWNVTIRVFAPRVRSPIPDAVSVCELDELLRTCDVICVLASLNPDTRHMLDASKLRLIKSGAVLVNTARGGLIDEAALYEVAREGRFKALALDTFEIEPLPDESPLRHLSAAILTPHCVGHTGETHAALMRRAVENLERLVRGRLPVNIRNPDVVDAWQKRWNTH